MNRQKLLKEKISVVAAVNSVLDNIYDILDATKQAGIEDEKTKKLEEVSKEYESLLKKIKEEEELTPLEQSELLIVLNQVKTNMENLITKYKKAVQGMDTLINQIFN